MQRQLIHISSLLTWTLHISVLTRLNILSLCVTLPSPYIQVEPRGQQWVPSPIAPPLHLLRQGSLDPALTDSTGWWANPRDPTVSVSLGLDYKHMPFCLHFCVGAGDLTWLCRRSSCFCFVDEENKNTQKQEDSAVLIERAGTGAGMKPRWLTVTFTGGTLMVE